MVTTVDVTRTTTILPKALETSKLIEALRRMGEGDVLTDADLKEVCGKGCRSGEAGYGYLQSAIRYVLKHHRIVVKRVRGAGCIKCLSVDEVLHVQDADRRAVNRRARRSCSQLAAVWRLATQTQQAAMGFAIAVQSTLKMMSERKTVKRLEADGYKAPGPDELLKRLTTD